MINLIVRSSFLQGDLFRPAFKLLDPFSTAAGIGAIGGVVNSIFGSSSQKSANKTNMRIAQMNNEAMLQAQRENNEWNRQTAIDMFNLENEYNSPSAVADRLRAAGFNPAVAMGNGTQFATSGDVSTPQAQAVPAFQQAQVSPVPSPFAGVFDGIEKYASAMSQLAQAKKHDADVRIAFEKLQPELDSLWSDVALKQAQALYQNTQATLEQYKAPYQVRLLAAEYTLAMSRNDTEKATKLLRNMEYELTKTKDKQLKLESPILIDNLKKQGDLLKEQKKTEQTKQALNSAQTKTENELRDFRILQSDAEIKHLNEMVRNAHVTGDSTVLENYLKFRGLDGNSAIQVAMRILGNKEKMDNPKQWEEYLRENGVIK